MAEPVIPLTFPYKPNGGWTPTEIWGADTIKPHVDSVTPNGMSTESRQRIEKLAVDTLEDFVNRYRMKYGVKPAPEVYIQYRDQSTFPANEDSLSNPTIKISGEAMPPPPINWGAIGLIAAAIGIVIFVAKGK